MQEKNKRLFENIISQGALQVANYIIPLITLPYQVRVVGVEKFGLIAFAASLICYFAIIVEFGFNWSATKMIAQNRNNKNSVSHIFNSVMGVKIILMFFSLCVLFVLVCCVPKFRQDWLIFLLSFLLLIGNNVIYPTWFFIGEEKVKYITCISITAKLFFMFSLFIFVKQPQDYMLIPLLNGLGAIISGIIGLVYAIKNFNLKLYIPKISTLKHQMQDSLQFFLANVATSLFSNTNTFCLGLTSSKLFVGYYAAAEKIFSAILGLRFPLDVSIFPYMAKNKDMNFFKKIVFTAIIINTIMCLVLLVFSKQLLLIVFGTEMIPAKRILQIFCIAAIIEFPSVLCGYQLLVIYNHKSEANMSIYITSAFHIIAIILLMFTHNITAYRVSLLVLCSTILTFFVRMYFVNKYKIFKQKSIVSK